MDFRFHKILEEFLEQEGLDADRADVIRLPGAAKILARPAHERDRESLYEALQVSYDLHHARQFYLINHEDCGAYGPEMEADDAEELEVHRQDLRAARDLCKGRFPDVEVFPCFAWLDGRVDRVE
jgi:hypothetical protein